MITLYDPSGGFTFNQKVLDKMPHLIKKGLYQVCKNTAKSAKVATRMKDKTGRVYVISTKSGRAKRHQASSAGESHASITGTLTNSIDFKVESDRKALFGYDNSTAYGKYLELGTRKISPRPTLKNAMKKERVANNNIMSRNVDPNFI